MVACIKEFGFRIPIVAKSDGTVVDGHLRLKAAKKLGLQEVPIVIADDLSDAQIKAFRLVANQSANWADWDDELLKLELEDLKNLNFDLDLTGFDLSEIDRLLSENRELQEDKSDEENVEENLKVISKVGDLWLLGEHRLLCGDSTKLDQIQKLMNGQVADMVFTDPPYNLESDRLVRADILRHEDFVEGAGEMSEQEFINFLNIVFQKSHFCFKRWFHSFCLHGLASHF